MRGLLKYLEQIQILKDQAEEEDWIPNHLTEEEFIEEKKENGSLEEKNNDYAVNMKRLCRSISRNPLLSAYQLTPNELLLIAEICNKTKVNCEQDFNVREICDMTSGLTGRLEEQFSFIVDLIDREILSAPYLHGHDYKYDLRALYGTGLCLNGLLWNLILGNDPILQARRIFGKDLVRTESAVDAALKMIGILFLYYPELTDDFPANTGICYGRSVNMVFDAFLDDLAQAKGGTLWKGFCSKHKLSRFWQKCLLLIYYYNQECDNQPNPGMIASLLAKDRKERGKFLDMLSKNNALSRKNLINPPQPFYSSYHMQVTEAVWAGLRGKSDSHGICFGGTDKLLSGSDYLSRIDPRQNLEQLILDQATREIIGSVIQRLKDPHRESFAAWGLIGGSLTGDPNAQHGCNILLHGVPGTGKTFIAGVIANELHRPLIQINANAIRGMFYGTTEKQARELFQEMRAIAKGQSPVFLLNEGDQLIHRRLESPSHSVDHAENALQSVFLEEMESFPGIIVVTSNLQSGFDEAMSRRFHYKLEIGIPDHEARIALWHLHLPQTIPGASVIAVESLARDFKFTGGQIHLVVLNSCHEAFLRGKTARLTLEDLRKYACLESGTSFERTKRTVGFAR